MLGGTTMFHWDIVGLFENRVHVSNDASQLGQ